MIMDVERGGNVNDVSPQFSNHVNSEKCRNISVSGNRSRENSFQEERASRKSEQIESLDSEKPRSVSISIPVERNKSPRNRRRYKKRYFCCGSLADGAVASANYSNAISVIIIIISLHLFFQPTKDDDGTSKDDDGINKVIPFSALIYAVYYIRSSSKLKRAIDEEQREKIIPWILFTTLTIFFLMAESVYVAVTYWEELDDFNEDLSIPSLRLILCLFLAFVGCTLIYCLYGVIRLFQSMAGTQSQAHSLMNDIRAFINGVSM